MKYFYTDPLAAAWMADKFGMKFDVSEHGQFELGGLVEDDNLEVVGWCEDEHFHIHPDSLHLLEPQVGDAVEFDRWHWERQHREETKDYPYQAHYASVVAYGRNDEYLGISSLGHGWDNTQQGMGFSLPFKIIQRNNTAFIWPEGE